MFLHGVHMKPLRVDSDFICYHLKVYLVVVPSKQQPQRSSKKHVDAVKEVVNKLKMARAIKEVFYHEWLANTVIVKKKKKDGQVEILCGLHQS